MDKGICPHCGKEFDAYRLKRHVRACKKMLCMQCYSLECPDRFPDNDDKWFTKCSSAR